MFGSRTENYLQSFQDNKISLNIFNLELDWSVRVRDPFSWNYITRSYDEKCLTRKLVHLIPRERIGKVNLKQISILKNCNIFFHLWAKIEDTVENPIFQLRIGETPVSQISLSGSQIFCFSHRHEIIFNNEKYSPIYLFELLEKKFFDLLDVPHLKNQEVNLIVQNEVGEEIDIDLVCEVAKYPNPRVAYRYLPFLIEEYCLFENIKEIVPRKEKDNYVFEFDSNKICPLFSLSFFIGNLPLWVKKIEVFFSRINQQIEFNDPRIIFRYRPNLHLISLFQSNNLDFHREGGENPPLGVHLIHVGSPVKIMVQFKTEPENENQIKLKLSLFEFNVISYNGDCHLVF